MTLAEYLQLNDMTHQQFADAAGLPRPTVTRLLRPGARPRWPHVLTIARVTGGKVTADDWMGSASPQFAPRPRKAEARA